jgi:hypothetical protein
MHRWTERLKVAAARAQEGSEVLGRFDRVTPGSAHCSSHVTIHVLPNGRLAFRLNPT